MILASGANKYYSMSKKSANNCFSAFLNVFHAFPDVNLAQVRLFYHSVHALHILLCFLSHLVLVTDLPLKCPDT